MRIKGKKIIFNDEKIKKSKESNFYKNKKLSKIDEIDFDKILISKKEPYGTKISLKYFIGYNGNDVIKPLCTKCFDSNKAISFKATDDKLLK